tara:strand:+ start:576 stop:2621 length:2046 start_codon:yes stop_codon:yes gene_type:complete
MKLKFLLVILLLNFTSVFSQDDKTVTLTVSAQGETISEAKQNALRDAIEQAFGAFISSNTEILNDELVKDEIVSVSNGNIQDFEVISEVQLPNGDYATTLKATVSVNKLSAFVESKGVEVEFKGGLLAVNIKQQILNEKNEVKTIENIDNVCRKILDKSYDYEIMRGAPKQAKASANSSNGWIVPLKIDVKFNENIEQFRDYFYNSVSALSMSESEIQKYQDLGKPTFTIGLGMGDELGGVWNNRYSLPIKQQYYANTSRKKLIKSIKQYFDSLKQKHPLKNIKYQLRASDDTKLDTENIADLVAWIKNAGKGQFIRWLSYINQRGGIDIIYSDVSVRSTYTFRTKATHVAIESLISSIKNSSLNFKITNGVRVIDRTYFDKEFDSYGFKQGGSQLPIISNKPVIEGVNFSPILSYEKIQNGFWGGNRRVNNRPHPGYASLYKLKFSFTQNINISKRFRGTKKFSSPGCYDFNIPIISLYDFNNTDKVILSLYYENLLTLSELEKVVSYQIYPTHKYLQSVKKNTKVSNNNQVSDKSNKASNKSITNSLASKTFRIKIQKNRTNINIRKNPVNGVIVGQVSGGELYTVTDESPTDSPIYLLNNDMVLTDFKTGEKIDKPKDFKLNNVSEHINNTYYAELINTDKTINKVYIEKNKVKIEYNSWYYLEEIKGWIYSIFCEKM